MVYAVMYGAGKEKLSEVLHISQSEARDIISSFMSKDELWYRILFSVYMKYYFISYFLML